MKCEILGRIQAKFEMTSRVYSIEGLSPTIMVFSDGGGKEIKIAIYEHQDNLFEQKSERKTAIVE